MLTCIIARAADEVSTHLVTVTMTTHTASMTIGRRRPTCGRESTALLHYIAVTRTRCESVSLPPSNPQAFPQFVQVMPGVELCFGRFTEPSDRIH